MFRALVLGNRAEHLLEAREAFLRVTGVPERVLRSFEFRGDISGHGFLSDGGSETPRSVTALPLSV